MATQRYESYLLRLWESDEDGQLIWRAACTQKKHSRLYVGRLATLPIALRRRCPLIVSKMPHQCAGQLNPSYERSHNEQLEKNNDEYEPGDGDHDRANAGPDWSGGYDAGRGG